VIALIDYGAGNLRSVHKALRYLGADVSVARDGGPLQDAAGVVLPGVGAFDDCMNALGRQNLIEPLRACLASNRPFLGICVGYQALFERSQEFNSQAPGLGFFRGPVVRFQGGAGLKVPQIGWNRVVHRRLDCPLFRGIPNGSFFYFVHSYFPRPEDASIVAGDTEYGQWFASAIWSGRVFATQFHPEKSQQAGLQLLRNFLALTESAASVDKGGCLA
jgi:imidazole glycerol-phosphate synthase subunit HisH